ncbi:hypothetical protein GOV13_01890 [Candidatus Pacearchaeota archaeon]|nr:hypothetical protein [Candidatus Pacearchaeota archaeon]
MVKIKKRKIELVLLLIVLVQIFLLINIPTADSYIISQKDYKKIGSKIIVQKSKLKELTKLGIGLLIGSLSIKQIGVVSARDGDQEPSHFCCPETNNGGHCQDLTYIWDEFTNPSLNYFKENSNCAEDLKDGTCIQNNCWSCCPENNQGNLCTDIPTAHPEQCNLTAAPLSSGRCTEDCLSCCPKIISEDYSDKDDFCIDTSRYHKNCADPLVLGTCEENNCKVVGLNEPTVSIGAEWEVDVSAASDLSWSCCRQTIVGAICQNIASTDTQSCAVDVISTNCENVADCKKGCCVDEEEGLCTTKATMEKCELDGGVWKDEENCLVTECQKGCCVLGNDVLFATEQRCAQLSPLYGFEKDFRDLTSEVDCLVLAASQIKSACVIDDDCKFLTESQCLSMGGLFSQGNICSNPALNTSCERQESVGLVDGKDELYWFDSCGNRENIYSSDRDASWNEGKLLSKAECCNPDESNADSSTCGNCDYFLGSRGAESSLLSSKVADGSFVCADMACTDEEGVERKNGESWCVYDSYIGEGKDTAGSRHWKRMCIDGEIKVEGCADYRGGICVQSEMSSDDGSETFTAAACVVNEAMSCLGYNSDDDMEDKCRANEDCMIKSIKIAAQFQFDVCVGEYPRGFDLTGGGNSEKICGMASQTCSVMYEKNIVGSWRCKKNCACEGGGFAPQMNDLCISLGDCGSYVNYVGEGTDNIKVSGASSISWKDYINYVNTVSGQFAKPKDMRAFLGSIGGTSTSLTPDEESGFDNAVGMIGTVSGGLGTIAGFAAGYLPGAVTAKGAAAGMSSMGTSASVSAFGYAFAGAAVGAMVGSYLAESLGRSGDAATALTVAGAVAGAAIGYASYAAGALTIPVVGWIALAIMVIISILGWGETEIRRVEFICMPWQAPTGGSDCDKCNDDPLRVCSTYKCSSLGQACKLLNPNTENPTCESIPNDGRPPVISESVIEERYSFENISSKNVKILSKDREDKCVPEFTQVIFSLETDEFAQCKFELQRTNNYGDMTQYPLEQTMYTTNHSFAFSMPSLGSLEVYNVTGDLKEMFGNMNMYVRCQDYHGNANVDEYAVNFCINSGPDLTAARIVKSIPNDGSYTAYEVSTSPLTIYLNEPAECKYDVDGNKSYETMSNSMECKTDLLEVEAFGWPCNTTLTGLEGGDNKFYIKCMDKPWVNTTEEIERYEARNVNVESFVYTLKGSESALQISSIIPEGEIEQGFEPISIDLKVKTSGGSENGKAKCSYSFTEDGEMIQFFNTFSNLHEQNFNTMMRGDHYIAVECVDEGNNIARGETNFSLVIDTAPPVATRISKMGDSLILSTDEEAECYYSLNHCYFDIDNFPPMASMLSSTHTIQWSLGETYYIKCRDIWRNTNPTCAMIVSPSFFE